MILWRLIVQFSNLQQMCRGKTFSFQRAYQTCNAKNILQWKTESVPLVLSALRLYLGPEIGFSQLDTISTL